jgi:plasmid stabilization system protein ParE
VVSGLPYIVVYEASDGRVLVLNIVHGAQRWP